MFKKIRRLGDMRKVVSYKLSSKGSDSSVYVLLYMFASYHLPPQQFHRVTPNHFFIRSHTHHAAPSQPQAIRFTSSLRIPLILLLRQHPSIINSKDFFKGMLLCGLHSQRPQVHYCYMARFLTFALIFFASFSFRFSLGIWINEFSYACISKCLL